MKVLISGCEEEKGEYSWLAKNRSFQANAPCQSQPLPRAFPCALRRRGVARLYNQLFRLLSQHSKYRDLRHLKALVWMIIGLIHSGKISLSEWECYIPSRATKAQSFEAARTRSPPPGG